MCQIAAGSGYCPQSASSSSGSGASSRITGCLTWLASAAAFGCSCSSLSVSTCPGHVYRISGLHIQQYLPRPVMPEQQQQYCLHALCCRLEQARYQPRWRQQAFLVFTSTLLCAAAGGEGSPCHLCCNALPCDGRHCCGQLQVPVLAQAAAGNALQMPSLATQPAAGPCLLRFAPCTTCSLPFTCLALLCSCHPACCACITAARASLQQL